MATPSISNVVGTISEGQVITIYGSAFGSGPNVVFFDNFEGGSNGATLKTGAGSATVGTWALLESGKPTYTSSQKISGNLAMQSNPYVPYLGGRGQINFSNSKKVFISFWTRTDAWPNNGNSVNWKIVWPMAGCCSDHDISLYTVLDSGGGGLIAGNSINGYVDWVGSAIPSLNTWSRMWTYVDSNSPGTVQFWYMHGSSGGVKVLVNHTGITAANSGNWFSSGGFTMLLVPGNVEIVGVNPHPLYDDVYVATGDNARARVEIGNNSNYNSCTNLTILTSTSWSASSINATVRRGSFGTNASGYLFVVDSSNAPSIGRPITFGSNNGNVDVSSPTGLHVLSTP